MNYSITLFKSISFFVFFSFTSLSQIDVNLVDVETRKVVAFDDISEKYNFNKNVPTILITWSGKWCYPCRVLIDQYNDCDASMINIITVNVDTEDDLGDVLDKGYTKKWTKSANFHANLSGRKGLDNIFNVKSAPLILWLENGKISDAVISYSLYPWKLVFIKRINNIKFIWNSSKDLNSLAWYHYNNTDDKETLIKAKSYSVRSMALNKTYNNTDTYASLLFKLGEYTKALKAAKEAIDIAKKNEEKHEHSTELIQKIIEKM